MPDLPAIVKSKVYVAHKLPHRTRLRMAKGHRTPKKLAKVSETLAKVKGVKAVQINHHTGSVVVHHDESPTIFQAFEEAFAESGGELLLSLVGGEEIGMAAAGADFLSSFMKDLIGQADSGIGKLSDNKLDLKTLIPLVFFGSGILGIFKAQEKWAAVPPIALLYYAFDSYWKMNIEALRSTNGKVDGDGRSRA